MSLRFQDPLHSFPALRTMTLTPRVFFYPFLFSGYEPGVCFPTFVVLFRVQAGVESAGGGFHFGMCDRELAEETGGHCTDVEVRRVVGNAEDFMC